MLNRTSATKPVLANKNSNIIQVSLVICRRYVPPFWTVNRHRLNCTALSVIIPLAPRGITEKIPEWKIYPSCCTFSVPGLPFGLFETVCQKLNNLAIWPFFGLFWKLKKIVSFKACFERIWAKITIFYKIPQIVLVILPKFHQKFGLYLAFFHFWGFGLFWNCLWPNLAFFTFLDLATLFRTSVGREG